jgi:hypothetical protein
LDTILFYSLEQAGHHATAVATISEAIDILQKDVPDSLALMSY